MSVTGGQQTHRPTCPKRWGGGEREREQKGGKKGQSSANDLQRKINFLIRKAEIKVSWDQS